MTKSTIDELEMLNPMELAELLLVELKMDSPDVQFIQDLLTVGCPIDARDNWGRTVLHLAAGNGQIEVVKFLVSNGADVNTRNINGLTPFHYAAWKGHLEVAEFLISKGADIYIRNKYGNTAWGISARNWSRSD